MDDNNIYITLFIKNIKEGLPTPPPSDRAVDQSGLTTTPTITGTTTPQSIQSSYFSPSPQRHELVPEAVPIRTYNRRPTEQQVVANLRPARSGRIIRPTNKAAGKAFATTIDTIDVQNAFIPLEEMEPPPIKPRKPLAQMLFPGDTNFTFRPQWHEQYAFATDEGRRSRQDLAPPPEHWQNLRGHPDSEGFKDAARIELEGIKSKDTYDLVPHPVQH